MVARVEASMILEKSLSASAPIDITQLLSGCHSGLSSKSGYGRSFVAARQHDNGRVWGVNDTATNVGQTPLLDGT